MPDRRFFEGQVQRTVKLQSGEVRLPILYYEASAIGASFAVSRAAVARLLPRKLRPAPWVPGLALMSVVCFEYRDTSIGPYGEVAVAFPCTLIGGGPVAELRTFGAYVWHLPVTTSLALEAGVAVWGYPKFLADIEHREEDGMRVCSLSTDGSEILKLEVAVGRRSLRARRVLRTYTVKDDEILSTPLETSGRVSLHGLPTSARLVLGAHPIAAEMRGLGLRPRAVLGSFHYPELQAVLPRADRTYAL